MSPEEILRSMIWVIPLSVFVIVGFNLLCFSTTNWRKRGKSFLRAFADFITNE